MRYKNIFFFITTVSVENEEDDTEEDEDIDEKELSEEYNIQQGFDDANILEEVDDTNEQEDADEENNILDNFDMEFDTSKEIIDNSLGDQDNDASEEFNGIRDINEIEDNNEPLEEVCFVPIYYFHIAYYLLLIDHFHYMYIAYYISCNITVMLLSLRINTSCFFIR